MKTAAGVEQRKGDWATGSVDMRQIYPNLFVGGNEACSYSPTGDAVVHACKEPCHRRAVGYQGNLSRFHPEYLVAPRGNHLYLNLVDMDQKLKHEFTAPIMAAAINFIGANVGVRSLRVHCNEGRSRAPTVAMLYLAKRAGALPNTGFDEAAQAFRELYPPYAPGRGLTLYLADHWNDIS